jgi:hypothetical protein
MATLYCTVGRAEKGLLLDHFCGVTGYNRKYALSLLGGRQRRRRSARRRLLYGAKVQTALAILWEAAGYICAERLRPFLPELLDSLERHRALVVDAETRAKLSRISVATLKAATQETCRTRTWQANVDDSAWKLAASPDPRGVERLRSRRGRLS